MDRLEPVEITAGRVHLRPWGEYDVDALHLVCQDPEISRWTTLPWPYTRADAERWCHDLAPAGWQDGTAATWAVLHVTTSALLGAVGLHRLTGTTGEVGYWAAAEARGHGYVTEAVGAVCRWGFGALGLERVDWVAAVGNEPSRAVAERCGFTVAGTRTQAIRPDQPVEVWFGSRLRTAGAAGA
jgi:RimJ/RimL family protein N-acetyltransferase